MIFDWLIIIGLAGWAWWQTWRIGALGRRVSELERRLADASLPSRPGAPVGAISSPFPQASADGEAILELDTPLPEASNDHLEADAVARSEQAAGQPALLLTEPAPPEVAPPLVLNQLVEPPRAAKPGRKFEQWISENAFAWLGAGALVLAGVYLVGYATQQNWFTPPVRLACAIVLGSGLIGAGEWVRRREQNQLVAALLAGAGAATFYAAGWAAFGLYHVIDASFAALVLTLCAAILVGLAFMHGEALALLGVLAALIAPALTGMLVWPQLGVMLYVLAVGGAGFAVSALRRWSWASLATLAGLYFWFAAAIDGNDIRGALALISVASVGGAAMALRRPLPQEAAAMLPWAQARQLWPNVAICVGSVLLLWAWVAIAPAMPGRLAGPALIAVFEVALAATAVRARVASPAAFAVSVAALVLGFALYLSARAPIGPPGVELYPTLLFSAFAVAASALAARAHRTVRGLAAGAGGVGAALLTLLAATTRSNWHSPEAWTPLFAGAALLLGAAWRASRQIAEASKDRAVDWWSGAGAALALIGVESALPAPARSVADAFAALAFATAFAGLRWRALRYSALAAGLVALAHAMSRDMIDATLTGALPLWRALLYLGAAAAALYAASRNTARAPRCTNTAEALSTAALLMALTGAFVALRWIAAGGAGPHLDAFDETALDALTLWAAGYLALPRTEATLGEIGRWRGHVLMGLGLLNGCAVLGLVQNPWWGLAPARIEGPLVLDGLLLGFAAPATIAFSAAARLYRSQRLQGRLYGALGAVLLVLWTVLELRRGFHGDAMALAPIGAFEAACYAIAILFIALCIATLPRIRLRAPTRPFTHDLSLIADASAWAALVYSVIVMLVLRHPWWGLEEARADGQSAELSVMAQAWAATLALGLGRALSRKAGVDTARFGAAAVASMFGLSFCHCLVRWLYHGAAMNERAPFAALEGLAHALTPLAYVLAASAITVRLPRREHLRAYLVDLDAIWSVAIWPALLFAALGLWFAFNPWWGRQPAQASTPLLLGLALAAYPCATGLSLLARRIPHIAFPSLARPAIVLFMAGHLLVGLTLMVRTAFHGLHLATAPASDVEMWSYSAAWAIFGAASVGIGVWRNAATLRWAGLAILCVTALKVFFIDAARLSGIIRALSFLGFGIVVTLVAIGSRRFRADADNLVAERRDHGDLPR
jgi:uncharacterized membrane protein